MPLLEDYIRPVRNRQLLVGCRLIFGTETERRRHEMPNDLPIERIARKSDTIVPQDLARPGPLIARAGPDRQNGKVARAAAEITDENQLVSLHRLLVAVGRGYR